MSSLDIVVRIESLTPLRSELESHCAKASAQCSQVVAEVHASDPGLSAADHGVGGVSAVIRSERIVPRRSGYSFITESGKLHDGT